MIAKRIYEGETAAAIGITQGEYDSRKETLDRYLQTTGGRFEGKGYLAWLLADQTGDRAEGVEPCPEKNPPTWDASQPSRGMGDTIAKITSAVGITPCGGCKARQKKLNKLVPFKAKLGTKGKAITV